VAQQQKNAPAWRTFDEIHGHISPKHGQMKMLAFVALTGDAYPDVLQNRYACAENMEICTKAV
jgi:hypothetical protein